MSGWAVTRTGNTRVGQSDPTRRWQGTRKGLSTLEFRVHKGVYVPSAREIKELNLNRLQKPHATRMKERAAEKKLREMILGKQAWEGSPNDLTQNPSMDAAEMWAKLRKKGARGLVKELNKAAGDENAEGQAGKKARDNNADERASESCSEDRESDQVSGMSLMRVSSMGVGQMGIMDIVQATFQAQELKEAERRQVEAF